MTSQHGFLAQLLQDKRANTLALMAAALVPLLAFSGSAIDISRLYVVKVRLQQACDAGVLAGRKLMNDSSLSTPLDSGANASAQEFFNNNFTSNFYQSTAVAFNPVKGRDNPSSPVANTVDGTATATVPMSIMQFFGLRPVKIDVACQAAFDLADTDVMFVLDTTGSMSCTPSDPADCGNTPIQSYTRSDGTVGYYNPEKSGSKIDALRDAVILFDTTIRANADATSHFRYGFVTYSSAVNVGYQIPSGYLQNGNWTYQSRRVKQDYDFGSAVSSQTLPGVSPSNCQDQRIPQTGYVNSGSSYFYARRYTSTSVSGSKCIGTAQTVRPFWRYEPISLNTSQWSTGINVLNPSKVDGSKTKWRGCVEEVDTMTGSSFDLDALPDDLDPDFKPMASNNKWRPQWPDAVWNREYVGPQEVKDEYIDETKPFSHLYNRNYGSGTYYDQNGSAACGMPAQRLKIWSAQQLRDYVNDPDFKPYGGTYHDVGMIWGTRMLSPDGVFAADTAAWPGRRPPSRNIVFMTDGTMSPSQFSYGQYGVEIWDNRTGASQDTTADYNNHTARFRIECDAAKKKGFTIYVVALGTSITSDLTYCASPGQTFQASSKDELTNAFKSIAQRVASLRINK